MLSFWCLLLPEHDGSNPATKKTHHSSTARNLEIKSELLLNEVNDWMSQHKERFRTTAFLHLFVYSTCIAHLRLTRITDCQKCGWLEHSISCYSPSRVIWQPVFYSKQAFFLPPPSRMHELVSTTATYHNYRWGQSHHITNPNKNWPFHPKNNYWSQQRLWLP